MRDGKGRSGATGRAAAARGAPPAGPAGRSVAPAAGRRGWLGPALAALLLAGAPFAAGKYFELTIPAPFDGAAYVYSAQKVLDGARIGVTENVTARPGTLVANMLGVWLFGYADHGPKIVQGVLQLAALTLSFVALLRLFGAAGAVTGTALAALMLSAPLVAKYGNVKEQYMIAFTMSAVSCLVLHRLSGRRWLLPVAGGLLAWVPLFKETGFSAIIAVAVFLAFEVLAGTQTARQLRADAALLLAGAALALLPLYVWMIAAGAAVASWPYGFVVSFLAGGGDNYISGAREIYPLAEQARRVLAFYGQLRLPIALAVLALAAWAVRCRPRAGARRPLPLADAIVVLLGTWWLLDMAFVWVSPRSYQEYYLPLNGSAAFLAAYLASVAVAAARRQRSSGAVWTGAAGGALLVLWLAWPVLFGYRPAAAAGAPPAAARGGYLQRFRGLDRVRRGAGWDWYEAAAYIRAGSSARDPIYVWGWIPGIYVAAQRFSTCRTPFTSEMHVLPPAGLAVLVDETVAAMAERPPAFIVDTRWSHFPWDRPPLELWPTSRGAPIANDPESVARYDREHAASLRQRVGEQEAQRYEAMAPLRRWVMGHYRLGRAFGPHLVFVRSAAGAGPGVSGR